MATQVQGTADTRLETLKKSVLKFSEALFEFQPDATIKITQFNTRIANVGTYKKEGLKNLENDVKRLVANGETCLYKATLEQLSFITKSTGHNNILLFTDGENSTDNPKTDEEKLTNSIDSIQQGSPLTPARNKFFIISYGANQPAILRQVTELFTSPVIDTKSADFVTALTEVGKMQEWASARELFSCRLVIDTEEEEYIRSYDMSGQFTALEPKRCKNRETIHLTIVNGNGEVLLDDKKDLAKASSPQTSASIGREKYGVFAQAQNEDTTKQTTPVNEFSV